MRVFFASAVILCPVLLAAGQPHGYLRKTGPAPLRFAESLPPPPLVNDAVLALDNPPPLEEEPSEPIETPQTEPAAVDPVVETPADPPDVEAVEPDPEPADEGVAPIFPEVPQATLAPPTNEPQLLNEITAILSSGAGREDGAGPNIPDDLPTTHGGVRPRMLVPLNVFTPPEPVASPDASSAVYRRN